jgi:tRNA-2-methylthio-N6-dimethylallyladenosine synthase
MTFRVLALGCQMNLSDSERITSVLAAAGYTEAADEQDADLLGVVACSVRQKAIDRIYSKIHEWNGWKSSRPLMTFVSGCILPEDERKFLKLFDLVFRIDDLPDLPEMVDTYGVPLREPGRAVTLERADEFWSITPQYQSRFVANVPIQNGCDKFCTFCAVPYTRGREVSRPAGDILTEVGTLVASGYRTINLLGQNVNSYGLGQHDPRGTAFPSFAELLDEVGGVADLAAEPVWVYFTSPHPSDMTTDVLDAVAAHPSLAKQIHLPLQSGDDKVLIRMNRNYRLSDYRQIVAEIRDRLPTATLFTDIIVGFCGETDDQFAATRAAMEEFRYNMAFVARYSPRPGAAAARWPDDIGHAEKKRRLHDLSAVLQRTALAHNQAAVGTTVDVLVEAEDRHPGMVLGRTEGRIPVRLPGGAASIGTMVRATVTDAHPLSLAAELAAPRVPAVVTAAAG